MDYLSYELASAQPNIIVTGAPTARTVLALSPRRCGSTPAELLGDLSAEIVFNYLDNPEFEVEAEYLSSSQFDEDSLIGIFSLLNADEAYEYRDLIIGAARAGTFGTYEDREAARICFVLQSWQDPVRSPLKKHLFFDLEHNICNILYEELLPRFIKIIEKIDYLEQYWAGADARLTRTEAALGNGILELEEVDDLDLAIVTTHGDNPRERSVDNIHPFAIHNATDKHRILLLAKEQYELYYRLESWSELLSPRGKDRIDLNPLAARLTSLEAFGKWQFDGCEASRPRLSLDTGKASLVESKKFREIVLEYLTEKQAELNAK